MHCLYCVWWRSLFFMMSAPTNHGLLGMATTIYIHGVRTRIIWPYVVFLAGKSPNSRSYTVYVYGSGQPYGSYEAYDCIACLGNSVGQQLWCCVAWKWYAFWWQHAFLVPAVKPVDTQMTSFRRHDSFHHRSPSTTMCIVCSKQWHLSFAYCIRKWGRCMP